MNENVHLLNLIDERDFLDLMEDDEAEYYEELLADQKQQVADAKVESEKLGEELKEIQAAAQEKKAPETTAEDPETGNTEEPTAEKNTGKSKAIMVVILAAALGFCGYWFGKKIKKNGKPKKRANTQDVDYFASEEMDIPVDTDDGERR